MRKFPTSCSADEGERGRILLVGYFCHAGLVTLCGSQKSNAYIASIPVMREWKLYFRRAVLV